MTLFSFIFQIPPCGLYVVFKNCYNKNEIYHLKAGLVKEFFMKNGLFAGDVPPSCEYCEFGRKASDHVMILCIKKGMVSPYYSCRKFRYSPLKRIPKRRPKLPEFTSEDFAL